MKKHKFKDGTKVKCIATYVQLVQIGISNTERLIDPFKIRKDGHWKDVPFKGQPAYQQDKILGFCFPESLLRKI